MVPEQDPVRTYLRILYKHRFAAAAALMVIVGLAAAYVFNATPLFEARTQLLIEVDNPDVIQLRESTEARLQLTTDDYQTEYAILRSRSLARRTLDTLNLWEHPEFTGKTDPGRMALMVGWVTSLPGRLVGLFSTPEETRPEEGESAAQSIVINRFLTRLGVQPVTNSRLVDVTFRSGDPTLAARVANSLARNYIDQSVEQRFEAAKTAADWLEARLREQRDRLEEGRTNLQRYRERNNAAPLDSAQNIVTQKLGDLNAAVTRAETERIEKQAAYERLEQIHNDQTALDAFPAIMANTFIQQLKSEVAGLRRQEQELADRLGDRHPDMIKIRTNLESADTRLKSEINKVVQAVENEYLAAQAQEQRLLRELSGQQQQVLELDRKSIDYGVLQREVNSNQQVFDSLLQRAKELGLSGELRTTNVRIVDQAEPPQETVAPRKGQTLVMAFLFGLVIAVGLAVGIEKFDTRIKLPAEISAQLGLPYLGLVPEIPKRHRVAATPLMNNGSPPAVTSAFEDLSANVMIMSDPETPRVIVVTSAGPGEGKTLVASNLAVAIAEMGQRVVLIDIDMRRPRVHEVFSISRTPGLTDLLAAEVKASEAVKRTKVAGLWLLPAGHTPENSAAFLYGSPNFKMMLRDFSTRFDWIIIDSPPVLAVADTTLIVQDVAGVVFVVNTKTTSRDAAQAAIERLDQAGAKFYGAVLNRANIERHGYYYDPYYRKEYSQYYGPTDAEAAAATTGATPAAANGAASSANGAETLRPRQKRKRRSGTRIRPPASRAYVSERDNW